jgi:hypothetical protein
LSHRLSILWIFWPRVLLVLILFKFNSSLPKWCTFKLNKRHYFIRRLTTFPGMLAKAPSPKQMLTKLCFTLAIKPYNTWTQNPNSFVRTK